MERAIASDAYKAVAADSPNGMAATTVIVAEQVVVVPQDKAQARIKRMSILERKSGLTSDDFRHEWCDKHAAMVAQFPAIAGYTQNLVTHRGATPGIDAGDDDLAADGHCRDVVPHHRGPDCCIPLPGRRSVAAARAALPAEYHDVSGGRP